jgi:polar amino acid transport system substrate-binding protein
MMGGDGFFAAVKEGKISLYEGNKNSDILALMAKRRLDCYVNERLSILWALKRMRMSGDYDDIGIQRNLVEGPTISREQTYLGYTDRDEGQFSFKADFVKKFDAAIDSMKQSGELQDIVEGFVKP